uniref:Uncharacterized protein n=1 Tax=Lepeophtheirus salmonis TaxID=72036 RepID=A0A0K2TWS8_LEPSM
MMFQIQFLIFLPFGPAGKLIAFFPRFNCNLLHYIVNPTPLIVFESEGTNGSMTEI